jgi:hypothetical protein
MCADRCVDQSMSVDVAITCVHQLIDCTSEQLVQLERYHATNTNSTTSRRTFADLLSSSSSPSSSSSSPNVTPSAIQWPYTPPICVATKQFACADNSNMTMVQPLVHQQHVHGACGYYAILNALMILRACCDTNDTRARDALNRYAFSSASFWDHYNHSLRVLTSHASSDNRSGRYPWRSADINSGILERLHLDYLLAHDTRLIGLNITALPELGPETLDELDKIFARFRPSTHKHDEKKNSTASSNATRSNWCHAFITGMICIPSRQYHSTHMATLNNRCI